MFIPGSGALDVDAVESYMLGLVQVRKRVFVNSFVPLLLIQFNAARGIHCYRAARQVPGVHRWGIEGTPPLDPVAKALRDASVRAQADPAAVPLAAVQRYEVLAAAAGLMPPSARLAHEAGLLGRHHTEALLPTMLKQVWRAPPHLNAEHHHAEVWEHHITINHVEDKHLCMCSKSFPLAVTLFVPNFPAQVVHKAQLQLPHSAFAYHKPEGCVVLSCFAGSNERRDGGGLPVAVTFSTYWERAVQAADKGEVSRGELRARLCTPKPGCFAILPCTLHTCS